mgnify:CR=1 FL=1
MQFTAAQIAMLINGQLEGDAQVTVSSFGKIEGPALKLCIMAAKLIDLKGTIVRSLLPRLTKGRPGIQRAANL